MKDRKVPDRWDSTFDTEVFLVLITDRTFIVDSNALFPLPTRVGRGDFYVKTTRVNRDLFEDDNGCEARDPMFRLRNIRDESPPSVRSTSLFVLFSIKFSPLMSLSSRETSTPERLPGDEFLPSDPTGDLRETTKS